MRSLSMVTEAFFDELQKIASSKNVILRRAALAAKTAPEAHLMPEAMVALRSRAAAHEAGRQAAEYQAPVHKLLSRAAKKDLAEKGGLPTAYQELGPGPPGWKPGPLTPTEAMATAAEHADWGQTARNFGRKLEASGTKLRPMLPGQTPPPRSKFLPPYWFVQKHHGLTSSGVEQVVPGHQLHELVR